IEAKENRAVVDINLSNMHSLSMTYGFHYSQELIKKVATALNTHSTERIELFNIYENQFVFYIKGYEDKTELIEFCEVVSKTLNYLLKVERIGGGIGVIEINQVNEQDIDQLLKNLLITSEKELNNSDEDFGF